MTVSIPELALVLLIGSSGSGKSTFAATHFLATEILSSDFFRGLISNDENSQVATAEAFETLYFVLEKRLKAGLLTVIDATNVRSEDRKKFVAVARKYHVLPVAIVLDLPESVCLEHNAIRPNRQFGNHVVRGHIQALHRGLRGLEKEGFRHVTVLRSVEEITSLQFTRTRLWNNLKHLHGAFDIIGDVHGCIRELHLLLEKLGYTLQEDTAIAPQRRTAIFLGDLVDRGTDTPAVLRLVMNMVASGAALCVPGNHDVKLMRALQGKNVKIAHGLEQSLTQLEAVTLEQKTEIIKFIDSLVSHYVLDNGKLVVVHAGIKESMQGRGSREVREFALYGETTGETDEFGLPVRHNWAAEYKGQALVVYGHTPTLEPQFLNRTICIDTGCVFGGSLTALRYPEQELVSVEALEEYAQAVRPLQSTQTLGLQQIHDDMLEIDGILGKRIVETRLKGRVTIREENAVAALEVMSRFAVNPKWLVYLPPTISPVETSPHPEYLERPEEAFKHYAAQGIQHLILEEKHMGSRAVVVICRDQDAARERFGVLNQAGMIYTRTGRRFFADESTELALLEVLRNAMNQTDFWTKQQTTWAVLDCELMPWSAKAQALLRQQYAPVGAAAHASLSQAVRLLEQAGSTALLETYQKRLETIAAYQNAYAQYCWEIRSLEDYKLAPFHLLATENTVHADKNHLWHLEQIQQLCDADPNQILFKTAYREVDLTSPEQQFEAIKWWEELTNNGGEGMVCKPLEFISQGKRGLIQPAMKIRGREYLRIIYGAEYTLPQNLERLKVRGLSAKRSLALREFALGIESLERFVKREALRRTHEAVFAVLALESEPVDSRL